MGSTHAVVVYGASGHTGRFVVSELRAHGMTPILSGRDTDKLTALGVPDAEVRPAAVDDPAALDRALAGAAAVINCAGPFATTTAPVVSAALRARIPYVDVAAEIEAVADTFAHFATPAREAGVPVVPAMAFFGGLGDLLATAALDGLRSADEVHIAYALSNWHPTGGTRAAGRVSRQRRNNRRVVYADGRMGFRTEAAPSTEWTFPAPVGTQAVIGEFTMADSVTIPRHLHVPTVHTYLTVQAAKDVSNPDTPAPVGVDEHGRSAQTFLVDVAVSTDGTWRRASARGRDIYAVSAPLAVAGIRRHLNGQSWQAGVFSAGEIFDAADFLTELAAWLSPDLSLSSATPPRPCG